jgi:hypothetical protein
MKKQQQPGKGNPKDKFDKKNKSEKTAKDLYPPNSPHLKNLREQNLLEIKSMSNDDIKEIKELIIISKPDDIFPEWPDEDSIKVIILILN